MSANSWKTWLNGGRNDDGLSGVSPTGVQYDSKIRGDSDVPIVQIQASYNHTHDSIFTPSITDNIGVSDNISFSIKGSYETRPVNYTTKYWKRIS